MMDEKSKIRMLNNRYYSMHSRCQRDSNYIRLGISVCSEWSGESGRENFVQWSLSHGFEPELQIDRIDTYGNYSPDNCRWITRSENARNTTRALYFEYNGETRNLRDICEEKGVPYSNIRSRINNGWSLQKALDTPINSHMFSGIGKNVSQNNDTDIEYSNSESDGLNIAVNPADVYKMSISDQTAYMTYLFGNLADLDRELLLHNAIALKIRQDIVNEHNHKVNKGKE